MSESHAARDGASGAELFRRMLDLGPGVSPDDPASKDIEARKARFEATAATLATARFAGPAGGQDASVHELPWYVVIGAPGSGNSTVMQNSGLHFPLNQRDGPVQVMGVGGTRYCEWWVSDEAVFIDIAGRYVAHETKSRSDVLSGSAAWHGFLGLMKQHRPHQPIAGAIVTVSVTDLLLWAKPERQQFAAHVRMRLAELYSGLGTRFPVYLLVTKMDLLAGFSEFFNGMDDTASAQVWGTTFDFGVDPMETSRAYAGDFAALQDRLYAEMLARLEEEPDLERRGSIYRFPQQFHAIGPLVQEMLGLAFSTHVDHQPLLLRGAYFTSASQAGKPIDRVMRTLERAFKLEHAEIEASGPGKGYFLTRLLREVIFPEAGLAVDDVPSREATAPARPGASPAPR